MTSESLDELNEKMLKRFLELNPDLGTGLGLHDPYDMDLPHGGLKRLTDTYDLMLEWKNAALELPDIDQVSTDQRIFMDELDMNIDLMKFSIDDYQLWKMYPEVIDGFGGLLFMMFSRDYAPVEERAKAISSRLQKLPKLLEEFRERIDRSSVVKIWAENAVETCEQFPGFLKFLESSWKDQLTPEGRDNLIKSIEVAERASAEHLTWLKELAASAQGEYAMGRDLFERLMQIRGFDMSADDILALGEKYLRDLNRDREVVANRISGGRGLEEAKKVVEADSPKDFEEALKATESEMEKAKRYIIDNNIATIDEDAVLKVVETPAFLTPILPYAALFMPSMFDTVQEGAYVVTRPKDPKDLGKHLNKGAIINTAVHEAYPGHFHQGTKSNTLDWTMQFSGFCISFDTVYVAAETVEGWAHYCEKMMFEHGYEATDAAALEMLNGAIWRAYRIIADIKLARGEATVDEMIDMGMKEAGMTRNAAESEVKRYTHTPGQALSYMLGRHLIMEFRKEMEDALGPEFDERLFHDLVAGYAYLPVHLMKRAVKERML